MMIWGRGYKTFPEVVETRPIEVFGATVTNVQLSIMLVAVVIMLGLWLLVDKTRLGKAMRAMADKALAKRRMQDAGVPCAPGYLGTPEDDDAVLIAQGLIAHAIWHL